MGEEKAGGGGCREGESEGVSNHLTNFELARKLARENGYRYVVLARRWPTIGWVYYMASVGSNVERGLRAWRREWEAGKRRG